MSGTSADSGYAATAAATALVMGYVVSVAWLLQSSYDVAGGVLIGHVLAIVTVPVLLHLTRNDSRRIRRLILGGLAAKLLGTLVRYAVVFGVYGSGDSRGYHDAGIAIAQRFRAGDFALGNKFIGTGFIETLTGLLYTVTGPTLMGGFLVFSWMGFWGIYLFFRAFQTAMPRGDHFRYGMLLFFLPSVMFWPSSIGKDAWMSLMLGATAYGAARLLRKRSGALLTIIVGLTGTALVRPHITVIAAAGLMTSYLLAANKSRSYADAVARLAGVAALAGLLVLAGVNAQRFFKLENLESIGDRQVNVQERTDKGSTFDAPSVTSPLQLPEAVVTVLFRPFPFEAGNVFALLSSLEGVLLMAAFVLRAPRLRNFVPRRATPFLTFAAVYSILFAVAFSNISNFGILARQRVQLLPLVLVALAVPIYRKSPSGQPDPGARATTSEAPDLQPPHLALVGDLPTNGASH
ncbi:MAG: hypothetical protein ACT4OS_06295 [Acidimicrobiales bacterium]